MQTLRKIDVEAFDRIGPEADTQLQLPLAVVGDSHAEIPSPARALQQRLLEDLAAEAGDDDGRRWAPRTTLLFCGGISLALWGAIALAIAAFR
jgi:hypothetical protein